MFDWPVAETSEVTKEVAEQAAALAQIQETDGYKLILKAIDDSMEANTSAPEVYYKEPERAALQVGARAALRILKTHFEELLTIANNPLYERERNIAGGSSTGNDTGRSE